MMEDLFMALLGGTPTQQTGGHPMESDPLTDLLGSFLEGGMAHPQQTGQAALPDAGGFAGIINGIMGGGDSNSITSSLTKPIANALANKLNLSPEIAQIIVTFVMGKLLSNAMGGPGASYSQSGMLSSQGRQGGFGLDDLLFNMDGGQGFDADYLQSTGMADALSQKTGLDQETAIQSMQEVFALLGRQSGSRQSW
jgi:hypothetical protein